LFDVINLLFRHNIVIKNWRKEMIKRILLILMTFSIITIAQDYNCEKIVNYKMDVALNPDNKTITGTQLIKWTNKSTVPVKEIYFHAYLNAFKNTESTFLKEALTDPFCSLSFGKNWPEDGWGYLEVNSINASVKNRFDSKDLLAELEYVQPDDQNANDQTVFKVVLPVPVNPAEEIDFNIQFTAKLPYLGYRAGFKGNYFFAGQWFPKPGVLVDGQWNCHQYFYNSEFFADFGDYDVSITVPRKYVIGASGVLTDSSAREGKITYRFQQSCVHDFAWTASPDFRVATKIFQYSEFQEIKIRLLYFPDHQSFVDEYLNTIEIALEHFGQWYLPYPYPQLTIVDVPVDTKTGNMEYPALITVDVPAISGESFKNLQWMIMHELGHQYWYGILANNESEHAWLDEGFASYSDVRCLNAAYGGLYYIKNYLQRRHFGIPFTFNDISEIPVFIRINNYRKLVSLDKMNKLSWEFLNYKSFKANVYDKGSIMLATLENYLGEDVFSKIMKTYATRYQFKHPVPQNFIDVVNEFSPQPMDWFFEQVLESTDILDYAVAKVTSNPVSPSYGLDNYGKLYSQKEKEENNIEYQSEILVERLGEFTMPVEVLVTFENGETLREQWNGHDKWKKYSYKRNVAVLKAEIDPENKILLDVNYSNNSKYRKRNSFPAFRWSSKWMFWLQHLFEVTTIFS